MFVDNLRLDVIATYEDNEQDHFSCGVWKSAIKSEKKLINYIKEQLNHKDLINKERRNNGRIYLSRL